MRTRAITGFFFVLVMLGSVLFGHYPFGIFFLLLSLFCLWEFYGLIRQTGVVPNVQTGMINGFFIYVFFALLVYPDGYNNHKLWFLLPLTLCSVFVQELFKTSKEPFANIAYTFLGLVFVCMPFTFFHALAYLKGDFNFHFPLGFMLMLWANDTGAYLVGRQFGRTKLFERHSPKKTWEGFIGGVVISCLVGYILSIYYKELLPHQWITAGLLISLFGTLGDLVESMFKRSINVKDSGGILPGHGGLLDRFDGLLLAAPIVYTYLYLILN